jgi:hypothetical protein
MKINRLTKGLVALLQLECQPVLFYRGVVVNRSASRDKKRIKFLIPRFDGAGLI